MNTYHSILTDYYNRETSSYEKSKKKKVLMILRFEDHFDINLEELEYDLFIAPGSVYLRLMDSLNLKHDVTDFRSNMLKLCDDVLFITSSLYIDLACHIYAKVIKLLEHAGVYEMIGVDYHVVGKINNGFILEKR